MRARRLGLATSRLPSLDEGGEALRLAPVNVEDLLLRPSVKIDYGRLESLVKGKSVVVTGGGGSIGAEICDRLVTFGVARLLVIENSEPALHAVLEALAAKKSAAEIDGRIADIRDRERIFRLVKDFQARHCLPCGGAQARSVARARLGRGRQDQRVRIGQRRRCGGRERRACDGDDLDRQGDRADLGAGRDQTVCRDVLPGARRRSAAARGRRRRTPMRLIAVRFGNVLASNGSVVPKFKAQIEAGGPVTVTHPDMVRYFMTIREACDLVVTAASHALGPARSDVAVYVLNMGQPVKIVDLAERIIRLSGLEPGRDIEIVFTGIRPGERLHEILFAREEPVSEIGISGVVAARPMSPSLDTMRAWLGELEQALRREERGSIYRVLRDAVPDFRKEAV